MTHETFTNLNNDLIQVFIQIATGKRTTDDDEAMDLDEMLKSTGEDEKGDRKRKGEGSFCYIILFYSLFRLHSL